MYCMYIVLRVLLQTSFLDTVMAAKEDFDRARLRSPIKEKICSRGSTDGEVSRWEGFLFQHQEAFEPLCIVRNFGFVCLFSFLSFRYVNDVRFMVGGS